MISYSLSPKIVPPLLLPHVAMRLTVLKQMAKGIPVKKNAPDPTKIEAELERIKWHLWHGDTYHGLIDLDDLLRDVEEAAGTHAEVRKFKKALDEFTIYIGNNKGYMPNYGERYRAGERISTGFVESTVNQVISKRFVKKQQMRWTKRGAHLLLQVRLQVLNNDFRSVFERWYPAMAAVKENAGVPKAA